MTLYETLKKKMLWVNAIPALKSTVIKEQQSARNYNQANRYMCICVYIPDVKNKI